MKKINVMYFSLACGVLFACNSASLTSFIPGTYTRLVTNEFSVGADTLVIDGQEGLTYTILHKGTYRRILQGRSLPSTAFLEKWSATYDANRGILIEQRKGKIISFDPSKNILLVGGSTYQKIK